MTSTAPTRDAVVGGMQLPSEDVTDHGTLCNLLQEGTQDVRVCGIPVPHLLILLPLLRSTCSPRTLHAYSTTGPQLGTLGITAPHNSTYRSTPGQWLCVVLCYAVGVLYAMCLLLCMLLCTTLP